MSPRIRKFIGVFGILAFLTAYVAAAAAVAGRLPENVWLQTVFFLLAGVLWGVPLIPFITWMNRDGPRR